MAQPDYVPLVATDRVRPSSRLSTPGHWAQDRPAEIVTLRPPVGTRFGATGPDLGFGLKLAHRVAERAILANGEHREDALSGCFASGCLRASHFHRAPVIHDMEWAFGLWGFLPGAPEDLVEYRRPIFAGAAHDYVRQRVIVDHVAPETLALGPGEVSAGLAANWRRWLGATSTG
ncbi:MAG TPA: hypothetical protein VME46_19235 [Acidimicrobiales bacterium]|nr:hypothetical protein [Acidimicrobiales bacterium]